MHNDIYMIQVTASDIVQKKILKCLHDSYEIRVRDLNEAIKLAEVALSICRPGEDIELEAFANIYLAYYLMIQSRQEESKGSLQQAEHLLRDIVNEQATGLIAFIKGTLYMKTDNYHVALRYLLISIEHFQTCNDLEAEARTFKMIGQIYELFGDYDKAEESYLKSIEISETIDDKNGVSNACNTLSGIYLKLDRIEEAKTLAEKSLSLKQQTNDYRGLGFSEYAMGKVEAKNGSIALAEKRFNQSLKIHQETGDLIGSMMALNKLGLLHFQRDQLQEAKDYFKQCIALGGQSKHYLIVQKAYYNLFLLAKKEKKFEEAVGYIELHDEFKSKVIDRDAKNLIHSIQAVSEMELMEKEAKWQKEVSARIERKNEELDSFVHKVSHDLKGPISSLMGLHKLIESEIKDPKSIEYFDIYHSQITRLDGILMDFMDLIQIKEKELVKEPVDFEKVINDCIRSFQYHKNFKEIDFNLINDATLKFSSDRSTINSIMQNLIENAIKYTNPGQKPFIKVNISNCAEKLCIQVSDNGLGIKKADQDKIFDMFYRAHDGVPGTGLGLYILKSAVKKLGGEIEVQSEVNVGSTFTILLPFTNSDV